MEIKINNKTLDASLENENTLGDVLAGIEQWLSSQGFRIAELDIDGQSINASMIEEIFNREINTIKCININTNAIAELTAASLMNLIEDIKEYENLNFEEKKEFHNKWKNSATAAFIYAEMPDLYAFCANTFSKGEMDIKTLMSITEEIQREVNKPSEEFANIEVVLNEICERLVDLPLDIQTGKDARAAQTIQLFSAVSEKIIRIFRQLDIQGYLSQGCQSQGCTSQKGESKPLNQLITEFGNVIRELFDAYEKNDSVLVGDLTEYEASPKIRELYYAVLKNCKNTSELQNKVQGNT
jgi:molybdopterin converting factor small subunit